MVLLSRPLSLSLSLFSLPLSLSLSISLLTSAGVSQAVTAGDRKILRTGQRQMKYDFRWHNLLMLESAAVRMGRAVRTRGGQGYVVS